MVKCQTSAYVSRNSYFVHHSLLAESSYEARKNGKENRRFLARAASGKLVQTVQDRKNCTGMREENSFFRTLVLRYRVLTAGYVTSGFGEQLVVDGVVLSIVGTLLASTVVLVSKTLAKLLF